MRFIYTILLVLFFYAGTAQSRYYISATGSDAVGNGSINNPWRTLYKATTAVTAPGSIIHVKAGTYVETEQAKLSVGVSIEGDGPMSVITSALKDDWKEILSLRSEEGTNGNQHIANLKFDGQALSTFWAIYVSGRSNVSIHDCSITDFKDRGVIFNGRNDDKTEPPALYATGNSFYNNTVTNAAAYNTPNGVYGRGCLNIGGQEGMLIYNNNMVQNQRPNGYNGYLIKYQNDGYLKGVKIYNNTLTKIPFAGNYPGDNGWDFAIELWNILGGMEIYGNRIQGAIDIVNTSKGTYPFGLWIHDNKIGQPDLNSHYESGIILEFSNESVTIENNVLSKISGAVLLNAQENTVLDSILIRNNRFEELGRKTGNGNNGSGININCGTLLGNTNHYTLSNLQVYNNTFIAAPGYAPFYGIEITNAGKAENIRIQKNTFRGFVAACFVANPANAINNLSIEDNILSGNGNNNEPFYIVGSPSGYRFKNNSKAGGLNGAGSGFNLRQQVIKPLYYEVKNITLLQVIAFISLIIFIWFARKESRYAFPAGLLYTGSISFISFADEHTGLVAVYAGFAALCAYGWVLWSKRDNKKRRLMRISYSSKKDWIVQTAVFGISYLVLCTALVYTSQLFPAGSVSWIDAFTYAALFAGFWLLAVKKIEGWYWWIAANASAIPAYFMKHYLVNTCYHLLLLVLCIWALYKWKRRMTRRRVQ
jgi:nicotinamide mononucleotide transporter